MNILQVTDFSLAMAMELSSRIAQGELIAIAGDRIPISSESTITVDFLGDQAIFPIGPYALAHACQCPLLSMTPAKYQDKYVLKIAALSYPEQSKSKRADRQDYFRQMAQKFAAQLEQQCIATPFQWFNFFPFWKISKAQETDDE